MWCQEKVFCFKRHASKLWIKYDSVLAPFLSRQELRCKQRKVTLQTTYIAVQKVANKSERFSKKERKKCQDWSYSPHTIICNGTNKKSGRNNCSMLDRPTYDHRIILFCFRKEKETSGMRCVLLYCFKNQLDSSVKFTLLSSRFVRCISVQKISVL